MDSRELKDAGNALVHWFNSQEIGQSDALKIMSKVVAKIIVNQCPPNREALHHAIDTFMFDLVNDTNAHTYDNRWGKKRER